MDQLMKLLQQATSAAQHQNQNHPHEVTEVTHQGFFSRLSESFSGILLGVLLIVGGCYLVYWNEGNYVKHLQSLAEGKGAVVSVASDKVEAANQGKLVHLTGPVASEPDLVDAEFGAQAGPVLELKRSVEMYQWTEKVDETKKKKLGGGVETTRKYTYSKEWSSRKVSSGSFKQPSGHENPGHWAYADQAFQAKSARLGAFGVPVSSVPGGSSPFSITPEMAARAHDHDLEQDGNYLYLGHNPRHPEVGDLRISFSVNTAAPVVSAIGQQQGSSLVPYLAKHGGKTVFSMAAGDVPAERMFTALEQSNNTWLWFMRFLGWVLVCHGISKLFQPLVVMADVVPAVGDLVGTGVGLVSILIGTPLVLLMLALGWLTARPMVGIGLLVMAGGLVTVALVKLRGRQGS